MYNAEKYIDNCLGSITSSDLQQGEYEIIVVDDGSIDNGAKIVEKYACKHPFIHYLKQENQGQSTARNYGIRVANGEYIWCVDADDSIEKAANNILLTLKKHPEIDILAIQLKKVPEQGEDLGKECVQPLVTHQKIISGKEAMIEGYLPSSVCALIIKKTLFFDNNIFFTPGITHQDVELTYRLMPFASKVLFSDYTPYRYIHHDNSTSKSLKPEKKIKYMLDEIVIVKSFIASAKKYSSTDPLLSKTINKRVYDVLFGLVLSLFRNRKLYNKIGVNKIVIDKLTQEGLYPLKGSNYSFKKKILIHGILNFRFLLTRKY